MNLQDLCELWTAVLVVVIAVACGLQLLSGMLHSDQWPNILCEQENYFCLLDLKQIKEPLWPFFLFHLKFKSWRSYVSDSEEKQKKNLDHLKCVQEKEHLSPPLSSPSHICFLWILLKLLYGHHQPDVEQEKEKDRICIGYKKREPWPKAGHTKKFAVKEALQRTAPVFHSPAPSLDILDLPSTVSLLPLTQLPVQVCSPMLEPDMQLLLLHGEVCLAHGLRGFTTGSLWSSGVMGRGFGKAKIFSCWQSNRNHLREETARN